MSAKTRYHHGNLRAALIDAGFDLAREGGPDAVVLREASRRVGVSHNAAYRHFPDREALLQAVGERCMQELALLMQTLIGAVDPADRSAEAAAARLRATGAAYVQFATTEPGLFRTGFTAAGRMAAEHMPPTDPVPAGPALADPGSTDPIAAVPAPAEPGPAGPFQLLSAQLDGLLAAGGMDPRVRPLAEFTAWSAVHGFSMLVLEGPLHDLPADQRQEALDRMLHNIEGGLRRSP